MRDPQLVAWRKEVTRTPLLQDSTKVFLLDLYIDGMWADGTVSIPRVEMARRLEVSAQRIKMRIADAISVGFLVPLVRGRKNTTAVYMIGRPGAGAVRTPRRAVRPGREPWRQNGAQEYGYKPPKAMDSGTGVRTAENGHIGTSDGSAVRACVPPVVTQANNGPAPLDGVQDPTPTATDAADLAVKDVGHGLGLKTSVGADFGADTAGGIGRGFGLVLVLVLA